MPRDLPEVLRLDEWGQPGLEKDRPSDTPTFQMIADVLASQKADAWKKPPGPNTHWSKQRG